MNRVELKGLDISCYTETLSNGLEIYLLPYENKKNYFISYATRFGSDIIDFKDKAGKKHTPPHGIAHFLEHKKFETESGVDPFTFFSESGTDANASTSFDNTQYICLGTRNFKGNLKYLLTYVNEPFFTDENVEKEKGIIAEEINMYADIPDFKLEMKLREALYKNSPRRIDIAGTVPEIDKITKEDLYACYNNFYTPNNMFVLIVGAFNPEEAISCIKEVVGNIPQKELPKVNKVKEPISVAQKEVTLSSNVEVPKIALGLKVFTKNLKYTNIELDLYLNLLTTILFGSSSEFRERVRTEKILNSIYTEWESIEDFRTFYLIATTEEPDKLLEEIKYELENLNISESAFERIKKVWIANEVKMIDNLDTTVNNLYDDILKYNKIIPNKIELIRRLKLNKLEDIITSINFKNLSIVKMLKEDKK